MTNPGIIDLPIKEWITIGASVAGTRHRTRGEPKQDSMRVNQADDHLAIAAADGAGSAPRSATGADLATRRFSSSMKQWKERLPGMEGVTAGQLEAAVAEAFRNAAEQIMRTAQSERREPRDYHTTLVALACINRYAAIRQTGDGGVIAIDRSGEPRLVSAPQRGQYVNETRFITMPGDSAAGRGVNIETVGLDALVLFTDGAESLLLNQQGQPHRKSVAGIVKWAMRWAIEERDPAKANDGLAEYLASDEVARKTDDDLTVCIAIPVRR